MKNYHERTPAELSRIARKHHLSPTKGNMITETETQFTPYSATMICEGVDEADSETQIAAWQYLIDTGLAWSLQGCFGRQARALIEQGICHN